MRDFRVKDKAAAAVIGAVIAVIVTLAIGLVVVNGVVNGVSRIAWTAAQNATYTSLITGIGSTYSIAVLYPMVLIAGAMLLVIGGAFAMSRN